MTVKLRVPEKRAENPSDRDFPAGEWIWEIEEIRTREIDPSENPKLEWMFTPNDKGNRRYAGPTAQTISLQLGKAQGLADGQDDPGEQKFFVELTIRDGKVYVDEIGVDAQEKQGVGYQIAIDSERYVNLALALGQTISEGGFVSPSDDFRDNLLDGSTFKGYKIAGKTKKRTFKQRDGSIGSKTELVNFRPVV